jgi:hypothetical protein
MSSDRRDPSNPPRPGMIWSDKHKLWMDPDTRTPERKVRDEEIAKEAEARWAAREKQVEHFFCPECEWTHAGIDEDGCCTACGADCVVKPCHCSPEVVAKAFKRMQESMKEGLDPKAYDFEKLDQMPAPVWRTWVCAEHGGYDDLVAVMLPLDNKNLLRIDCGCMRPYNEKARDIARQLFGKP